MNPAASPAPPTRLSRNALGRRPSAARRRQAGGRWFARLGVLLVLAAAAGAETAWAQAVLVPWGNLAGMRVRGGLVEFEAGLRVVQPDWTGYDGAVKYLQKPRYSREGARRAVTSAIGPLDFTTRVEDTGPGTANIRVEVSAARPAASAGVYYCLDLPAREFQGGTLHWLGTRRPALRLSSAVNGPGPAVVAEGVRVTGRSGRLEIRLDRAIEILVRSDATDRPTTLNDPSVRQRFLANSGADGAAGAQVYFRLLAGDLKEEARASATLAFKASVTARPEPVEITLDPTRPGRPFDGIGGNFRLQFPETDPAVIAYNLANLPVAWGRVEMPWAAWDPDADADPEAAAREGRIEPGVRAAMEMARVLHERGMPVIVSAWTPPRWARLAGQPPGLRGTALDPARTDRIAASLAGYLAFLKERHGVEAALFSFNEPEIGVDVRQTPAEHARFLHVLGAAFASKGLTTKLILGDTAHGTPSALAFLQPSLDDPATHPHIGAVAFHTWRGCTEDILPRWDAAARRLGVPLLVTESGPDAHLHEYPPVMLDPWFQLEEIELLLRVCAHSQPAAVMHWQLTTDYSVLQGGGVYGATGPLRPTWRFWNLRQLGLTPPGAASLPVAARARAVTCAAFARSSGETAVHVVNRSGRRHAVVAGFPGSIREARVFVTDTDSGMAEGARVPVRDGRFRLELPAAAYVTLLGTPGS